MSWTGPAQSSTPRTKNLREREGMRNQCLEATKLANSRKKKTSSYTDADVTNQAAIDTTSVFHKNQGILSTEIYST